MTPPTHTSEFIDLEVRDRKAFVTLNRPQVLNAMNQEMRLAMRSVFERIAVDDDILVAIVSGAGGRAFSSGVDLKERVERDHGATGAPPANPAVAARYGQMPGVDEIDMCPKPVIAAIDGYCLAGGFELALYCDIRVATLASTFGLPEPRRGLIAGPGLINLSRAIPLGEALRMQLTGAPITAERAYQIGLVQELAEDRVELFAKAEELADQILECAPLSVQYIKRIIKDGRDMTIAQAWKFSEMYSAVNERTEDHAEGPRAFAEHRPPRWQGR